jgi:hypothetical protein
VVIEGVDDTISWLETDTAEGLSPRGILIIPFTRLPDEPWVNVDSSCLTGINSVEPAEG